MLSSFAKVGQNGYIEQTIFLPLNKVCSLSYYYWGNDNTFESHVAEVYWNN